MIEVTLSIAGSDSCAGAGIQADLKTFSAHGVHALTAVTAVVSESPHSVDSVFPLPVTEVVAQIESVSEVYPIKAIKLGMLHSAEIAESIAPLLSCPPLKGAKIVIDPILSSSTGDQLSKNGLVNAYREHLFPLASLITPNIPEAEAILGKKLPLDSDIPKAAQLLSSKFGCATLLKGGHGSSPTHCFDYLSNGNSTETFQYEKINIPMAHGTGCSLSAAITANLAKGLKLTDAISEAGEWLHKAIEDSIKWNHKGRETYCLNQAGLFPKPSS